MATRYWVGGTGTWTGTTHWSATSAVSFSASCIGTALITTGSPALVVGMTVWSNNNTSLGTISSGSGNSWVVSVGGTYTLQGMTAATVGATAPTNADSVIFDVNSSPTSYTVTTAAGPACLTLTMNGPATGTLTFAGTNNLQFTGAGDRILRINTPSTIVWTNTGSPQFTGGAGTVTFDTNGCNVTATSIALTTVITTVTFLSDFTTTSNFVNFDAATINLNNRIFTVNNIDMSAAASRAISFGTGKIVCTGSGTAFALSTGATITGSGTVEIAYNGATAVTVSAPNPGSASAAVNVKTTGAGTFAFTPGTSAGFNDLDLSGHAGSLAGAALFIYGNLTFSSDSAFSVTSSANAITFGATSGSKTITTNAKQIDRSITFNGAGGTWVLQDALTIGPTTTRTLTQTAGTLDLNGNTLTTPGYATAAGTKNLTFNGGTLAVTGSGATAFNNAAPTGFTTTAGTGTGIISMTSATAKTFVGGGSTFNATLNQGGVGALTLTGANTFGDITNTVQPATVLFTAATTTTFTNGFNLRGTAGNLITIGSVTAASHTLSKASGTISTNYLSISRSTATGGAAWYCGNTSTDGGNNSGWFFSQPITTVNVTGVNAASAVGSAGVTVSISALITGTSATTATGSVTVTGPPTVVALGGWNRSFGWGIGPYGTGSISAEATGRVGSSTVSISMPVSVTGVSASGQVGTANVAISSIVSVTGSQATGQVGTAEVTISIDVAATGVGATGQVGTNRVDIDYFVFPTGVSATAQTNAVFAGVVIDCDVYVAGVQAIGYGGLVLVWGQLIPNQSPNWTEVDPADAPGWTQIVPSQSSNWTEINAA